MVHARRNARWFVSQDADAEKIRAFEVRGAVWVYVLCMLSPRAMGSPGLWGLCRAHVHADRTRWRCPWPRSRASCGAAGCGGGQGADMGHRMASLHRKCEPRVGASRRAHHARARAQAWIRENNLPVNKLKVESMPVFRMGTTGACPRAPRLIIPARPPPPACRRACASACRHPTAESPELKSPEHRTHRAQMRCHSADTCATAQPLNLLEYWEPRITLRVACVEAAWRWLVVRRGGVAFPWRARGVGVASAEAAPQRQRASRVPCAWLWWRRDHKNHVSRRLVFVLFTPCTATL